VIESGDSVHEPTATATVQEAVEPVQVLRDADLAADLGLSAPVVDDALQTLAAERLMSSRIDPYAEVDLMDVKEIRDANAVVRVMHQLAANIAVPLLTEADLEQMEAANKRFAAAVKAGDVETASEADDELHGVLVRVAGNQALAETIKRYAPTVHRLSQAQFGSLAGRRSVHRHADLIRACRDADPKAAVDVTRRIFASLEEHLRSPN
jgi:DNA-binding GntR family transcriptional regulator